ncbi:MAG: hypothetical protein ACJA1P_001734 [Maribacter sp.]
MQTGNYKETPNLITEAMEIPQTQA